MPAGTVAEMALVRPEPYHSRAGRQPQRRDTRAARTGVSMQRWFATAHTAEWRRLDGGWVSRPRSLAHARQMGTLMTACGARAQSWPKFRDLAFLATEDGDACPSCRAALVAGARSDRMT